MLRLNFNFFCSLKHKQCKAMNSLKLILSDLKYFSVVWVFSSLNILMGSWVLYIPYIKNKLSINDSELGFALFSYALGILLFLPFVPLLNKKIGTGKLTNLGIIFFSILFILPILSSNYIFLCISLFLVGIFSGITDISMNALVSEIEKNESKRFMSAAHGFFSLGGVLGGVVGSIFIFFSVNATLHLLIVISIILLSNLILRKNYINIIESKENNLKERKGFELKKLSPLIGLAFIAFAMMCSEGAIENWSNLYLLEIVKISNENLAGLGFVVFSIFMTTGRFLGDMLSNKLGSKSILIYGSLVAILAYFLILSTIFELSIFGFGLLGIGLSVLIPEIYRISGKTKGLSSSAAISFVSGIGFTGFLIGPVLLGFISNYSSLRISFVFLLILVFVAFLYSLFLKKSNSTKHR